MARKFEHDWPNDKIAFSNLEGNPEPGTDQVGVVYKPVEVNSKSFPEDLDVVVFPGGLCAGCFGLVVGHLLE